MALGKFLKVTLILLGIVFLLLIGTGIYLYNFYIFETVEICTGGYIETPLSCEVVEDCLNVLENPEEFLERNPKAAKVIDAAEKLAYHLKYDRKEPGEI